MRGAIDYENRFRDPAFLEVWDRWQKARGAWSSPSGRGAFNGCTITMGVYNPDPTQLTGATKEAAEEFLAARTAYLTFLQRYAR
jgi:hypothetical protein